MIEPPKPEYNIVEREGRLVVEKTGEAPHKPALRGWSLPKQPSLRLDWIALGQKLLARRHTFETTEDGRALLTADQLASTVKLSARGDDLHYLTPRQQAMIGVLGVKDDTGATIAIGVAALFLLGIFGIFWLVVVLFIAVATLSGYFESEYDAIQHQQYVPPDPSAPVP
ncbi:hypothetical protein [Novosphingobium sp.]|uniref:hypothetical protein n=1 Tax=Novosphingobium sp. TaxID=1874826 RepID=UPI00286BBC95|nr:hypothetical protein [Novosphingobium sp.]